MKPKVSILIPTYNSVETLPLALASVRTQTYDNIECVIVNDGSSDCTKEYLDNIHDPRFKVINLEQNVGRGMARNIAIENSTGYYVSWLDSDDFLYPEKIEKQIKYLDSKSHVSAVSSKFIYFDDEFNILGKSKNDKFKKFMDVYIPAIPFAPMLVKRSVQVEYYFDEKYKRAQDFDMIMRMMNEGVVIDLIDEILYAYRCDKKITVKKYMKSKYFVMKSIYKNKGYYKKSPLFVILSLLFVEIAKIMYYVYKMKILNYSAREMIINNSSNICQDDLLSFLFKLKNLMRACV